MLNCILLITYYAWLRADDDHHHHHFYGGFTHGHGADTMHNVNGDMGGAYFHHRGLGEHGGDTGINGILFTSDALHHGGDGQIFVSGPNEDQQNLSGMGLDQLHQKMAGDIAAMHEANIKRKQKQREAALLESQIAQEIVEAKEEEISRLKHLDDVVGINEHKSPEVLGKKVIPVATFTEETMPLRHHVRYLLGMIGAMQATENANIEAQRKVAKLDDITDQFRPFNAVINDENRYKAFQKAADLDKLMPESIPVTSINGDFYVTPSHEGEVHHHDDDHLVPAPAPDGHTHFSDHGLEADPVEHAAHDAEHAKHDAEHAAHDAMANAHGASPHAGNIPSHAASPSQSGTQGMLNGKVGLSRQMPPSSVAYGAASNAVMPPGLSPLDEINKQRERDRRLAAMEAEYIKNLIKPGIG